MVGSGGCRIIGRTGCLTQENVNLLLDPFLVVWCVCVGGFLVHQAAQIGQLNANTENTKERKRKKPKLAHSNRKTICIVSNLTETPFQSTCSQKTLNTIDWNGFFPSKSNGFVIKCSEIRTGILTWSRKSNSWLMSYVMVGVFGLRRFKCSS